MRRSRAAAGIGAAALLIAANVCAVASAASVHPGVVTHAAASSWTSTSIGLRWRNPRTPIFRSVVVRVARGHIAPSRPTAGTAVGITAGQTLTAHGLLPHTGYTFALFARDGAKHYGHAVVIRAITSPAPVTHLMTSGTDSAAVVSWADPPSSSFTGVVARIAKGHAAPSTPTKGAAVHLTSPRVNQLSLPRLTPATTYAVALWSYDGKHHYSTAKRILLTTRPIPGPASRPHATITAVSASRVTQRLTWANPTSPDLTGVLVRRATGTTAPTSTSGVLIADVPASRTSVTDTPSKVGAYTYGFFAHDSSGHLAKAAVLTVSTDTRSSAPPAIQGRVTTAAGAAVAGASVTGTVVDDDLGEAATTVTDADGYYTLHNGVYPGNSYQLCVQAPVHAATSLVAQMCRADDVVPGTDAATRGVDLVLSPGAHVRGHITAGGVAVEHAVVTVLDPDDDTGTPVAAAVTTDANGAYDIGRLPSGRYVVCVDAGKVLAPGDVSACSGGATWQPGEPAPVDSTAIDITKPTTVTADLALASAGSVAGTVRDADQQPVGAVTVTVRDPEDGSVLATGQTADDGSYDIGSLAPTTAGYLVCFDASGSADPESRSECWQNTPWNRHVVPGDSTLVPVTAGQSTAGIDAALAAGASISGTVTGPDGPLGGVSLQVFDATTGDPIADATSDATGAYTVGSMAPAAGVVVCADAGAAIGPQINGYLDRCLGPDGGVVTWRAGDRPPGTAAVFALAAGTTLTDRDFALPAGNAVIGTVTGTSGRGVAGVTVYAFSLFPERVLATASTDTAGSYRLAQLETGSVLVCVLATTAEAPSGYASQCVHNLYWNGVLKTTPSGLTSVAVPATGVRIQLNRFAAIAGTITTGSARSPVVGATITVMQPSGELAAQPTLSASDGTYTVPRLPAGTYRVCVDGSAAGPGAYGYESKCFRNVAWNRDDLPSGTSVTTTAGATTGSVDLSLDAAGRITGRVLASGDGAPVRNVDVLVYDETGEIAESATSTGSGGYSVSGLDPHFAYTVCFDPPDAVTAGAPVSLRAQCMTRRSWAGVDNDLPADVSLFTPTSGRSVSLGDTPLTRAGSVSGTVTSGATQAGVSDATVYAFNANGDQVATAQTDSAGRYYLRGFGGAPGGYRICAYAPVATGDDPQLLPLCYADTAWDGGFTIPAQATVLSVPATSPRTRIDMQLPRE